MREITLQLIGQPSPPGEILVSDISDIGTAAKDLVYRLTREAADRGGLGRTAAPIERLAEMRVALRAGSTVLQFRIGDPHAIEGTDPYALAVDLEFAQIVAAFSRNERIPTSATVAEAALRLAKTLKRASTRVEVEVPGVDASVSFQSDDVRPEVWAPEEEESPVETTLYGWLQMVDVRSGRFRIQDAAGNDIDLYDVADPTTAARLVTQRVSATGHLVDSETTRNPRLRQAIVAETPDPLSRLGVAPRSIDLESELAYARLVEVEPIELSDEEFDAFMAAVNDG